MEGVCSGGLIREEEGPPALEWKMKPSSPRYGEFRFRLAYFLELNTKIYFFRLDIEHTLIGGILLSFA